MEEKKEEADMTGVGITLTIIVFVILASVFLIMLRNDMMMKEYAEDAKDAVLGNPYVSDDYKQGWIDGIDYYLDEMTKPTNMTVGE